MLVVGPLHLAQGRRPASWLQVSNAVHVLVQQKLMPTQEAGTIIAVHAPGHLHAWSEGEGRSLRERERKSAGPGTMDLLECERMEDT